MFTNASPIAPDGRGVVLNFWETSCGPCIDEMAGLLRFQQQNPEVLLLAVALDSKLQDVTGMVAKRGWAGLNVAVPDGWKDTFGVTVYPTTYVLDGTGMMRFVTVGELPDPPVSLKKMLVLANAVR
jgi:cytochrome c biogenesis protein CcmG, thiol:disulfide interchange protein DsbE